MAKSVHLIPFSRSSMVFVPFGDLFVPFSTFTNIRTSCGGKLGNVWYLGNFGKRKVRLCASETQRTHRTTLTISCESNSEPLGTDSLLAEQNRDLYASSRPVCLNLDSVDARQLAQLHAFLPLVENGLSSSARSTRLTNVHNQLTLTHQHTHASVHLFRDQASP